MRYAIKAWGSESHPDLDYESEKVPTDLGQRYPYVDIALLVPILITKEEHSLRNFFMKFGDEEK